MERDKQPLMEPQIEEKQQTIEATWTRTTSARNNYNNGDGFKIGDVITMRDENIGSSKSISQAEWYMNNNPPQIEEFIPNLKSYTQQQINVCSSNPSDYFCMQPLGSTPLLNNNDIINVNNNNNNNPFGNIFDFESQNNFNPFEGNLMDFSATNPSLKFPKTRAVGFGPINLEKEKFIISDSGPSNSFLQRNSKVMRPLESLSPIFVPPTLVDKKEMHSNGGETNKLGLLPVSQFTSTWLKEFEKKMQKGEGEYVKGLNYETNMVGDIGMMGYNENQGDSNYSESKNNDDDNNNKNVMDNSDDDKSVAGGNKKGKKEASAKSLMAEKRRRKKLSDSLYMLRSIVPKISKMDKASILGDAIDYLKELTQRISDLHSELNVTPSTLTIPIPVKDELAPSNVSRLKNQSAKVEVMVREGRNVDIHMICPNKPGILLSTMRTLDNLGLDVQQASISSFNDFSLDVFKAEQWREGQDLHPEQIQAVLLDTVGLHGML